MSKKMSNKEANSMDANRAERAANANQEAWDVFEKMFGAGAGFGAGGPKGASAGYGLGNLVGRELVGKAAKNVTLIAHNYHTMNCKICNASFQTTKAKNHPHHGLCVTHRPADRLENEGFGPVTKDPDDGRWTFYHPKHKGWWYYWSTSTNKWIEGATCKKCGKYFESTKKPGHEHFMLCSKHR